jgi:hypothetical protein
MNNNNPLKAAYYCVSFIDLLGQRLEYKEESLIPGSESAGESEKFKKKWLNTVGAIYDLQKDAELFLNGVLRHKSSVREQMLPDLKPLYDEMWQVNLKQQRWSDGFVYFISLRKGDVKCHMVGVLLQFLQTARLCFFGLAKKRPLRGAVDIDWATELNEGELYGPAVAKAYELESEVAQYPRIVVGPRVVEYLISHMNNPATDIYSRFNRALAKICYDMLALDSDGYHFIHYLGDVFYNTVSKNAHKKLYDLSMEFILEQCKKWSSEQNTKLAFRYNLLLLYFLAHPPPELPKENTNNVSG